jgi:hypothetical protein
MLRGPKSREAVRINTLTAFGVCRRSGVVGLDVPARKRFQEKSCHESCPKNPCDRFSHLVAVFRLLPCQGAGRSRFRFWEWAAPFISFSPKSRHLQSGGLLHFRFQPGRTTTSAACPIFQVSDYPTTRPSDRRQAASFLPTIHSESASFSLRNHAFLEKA